MYTKQFIKYNNQILKQHENSFANRIRQHKSSKKNGLNSNRLTAWWNKKLLQCYPMYVYSELNSTVFCGTYLCPIWLPQAGLQYNNNIIKQDNKNNATLIKYNNKMTAIKQTPPPPPNPARQRRMSKKSPLKKLHQSPKAWQWWSKVASWEREFKSWQNAAHRRGGLSAVVPVGRSKWPGWVRWKKAVFQMLVILQKAVWNTTLSFSKGWPFCYFNCEKQSNSHLKFISPSMQNTKWLLVPAHSAFTQL